jgi:hypothetical protein
MNVGWLFRVVSCRVCRIMWIDLNEEVVSVCLSLKFMHKPTDPISMIFCVGESATTFENRIFSLWYRSTLTSD